VHVPRWLATPGMGMDKIVAFYDDEVKVVCERYCLDKAVVAGDNPPIPPDISNT
jgi:hypothetical protein